jgi:hypothetical protein
MEHRKGGYYDVYPYHIDLVHGPYQTAVLHVQQQVVVVDENVNVLRFTVVVVVVVVVVVAAVVVGQTSGTVRPPLSDGGVVRLVRLVRLV